MAKPEQASHEDQLLGCPLGTALGGALGLPLERLSAKAIERRFGRVDRFRLLGSLGFVSDDTKQASLLAHSLARHPTDNETCARGVRPWRIGNGYR